MRCTASVERSESSVRFAPGYGECVGHIDLRPLGDDDLDAVFEMMRDAESVRAAAFTAADPGDRVAFDQWMARNRASADCTQFVVTESGGFAGTAATFTAMGDREVTYWIARHAMGRGVATAALRLLISREAERPLFARAATHNLASIAVLQKTGFTEVSRDVAFAAGVGREIEEVVFALLPALE